MSNEINNPENNSQNAPELSPKGLNKKLLLGIAGVIVLAVVVPLAILLPKNANAKKVSKQLSLGEKYLSELDYEQAIAAYELAIQIDPKNEDAYIGLAEVYIAMGDLDKAEEVLKDAEGKTGNAEIIRKKLKEIEEKRNENVEEPTPTATPEPTPKPTATPTSEPTPTVTPEPMPTPEPTPTSELTPTLEPTATPTLVVVYGEGELVDLKNASVGNRVLFGTYEQDADISNGAEPIEWYVLDKQGDKVLLLSKYILDAKRYNKEYTNVTWENCMLRSWLNNDFYNTAFNGMEKAYVLQTMLDNLDNPYLGTAGGNVTEDKIFLLSLEELKKYFGFGADRGVEWEYNGDIRLLAHGTRQAYENNLTLYDIENNIYCSVSGYYSPAATGFWWLRSPGHEGNTTASVDTNGLAHLFGYRVNLGGGGVRPALWLNLSGDFTEMPKNTPTPKSTPKPTPSPTPTPIVVYGEGELVDLKNASVGNRVLFGSYEQDADTSNGAEPIEWYVLDRQGDEVLLLSKYILEAKMYDKREKEDVTWETCILRSWLNGEFYDTAFRGTEKSYIQQVTLDNPDNPYYGTKHGSKGGNATDDRVFLLSLDEMKRYFGFEEYGGSQWDYGGDTRLLAHGTRQAYENNLFLYDIENHTSHYKSDGEDYSSTATGFWWLRSPGDFSFLVAIVDYFGDAVVDGTNVFRDNRGVRPAIWLNLNP